MFTPAFDKRNPDPHKNYGIHCVDMYFVVKGKKGAVSFQIMTGWFLEKNRDANEGMRHFPIAADILTHSIVNYEKLQEGNHHPVCMFTGKGCYSNMHSLLWAEQVFNEFCEKGEKYLWGELEKVYREELK